MTKVDLTPAFLIHRRAFKDTSLLLDFFTRDYGKIRLVGRGARGSKTNIQTFQRLNISFSGKGELKTLTNWEVDDAPRSIKSDALIFSMYVNELISRLLHEQDPHPELFEIYWQFVHSIAELDKNKHQWLLRLFENELLNELGYGVEFTNDVDGNEINPNDCYEYLDQTGFKNNSVGKISGKMIFQLLGANINDMPNADQLKVCRDLNRSRLNPLLGDKPLQSRSLFFTRS